MTGMVVLLSLFSRPDKPKRPPEASLLGYHLR